MGQYTEINMSILLLSEIFPPTNGGSGRWFYELYKRLNVPVTVITNIDDSEFKNTNNNLTIKRTNYSSSQWGIKSVTGFKFHLRSLLTIFRQHKLRKFKAIHCGRTLHEGLHGAIASRLLRIPLICYVHGEDVAAAQSSRELKLITKLVFLLSDKVIANSTNTINVLIENWKIPRDKINLLNPGTDCSYFTPTDNLTSVTNQPLKILTVGRLQKRKGHDTVIKTLPSLVAKFPDLKYQIVGDGEEYSYLKELAESLGVLKYVEFTRNATDELLLKTYQGCDLFILANREVNGDIEGFGMVLVEAQACGKVVIAGASGGTKDTLIENKTGYLVDCTSQFQLELKITELLSNPIKRKEMGLNGRKYVEATYDWEQLAIKAKSILITS